jgi:hypothetical protein
MSMRPLACALICSLSTWCASARADGGQLRCSGKQGGYQITVLTSPTPLRAGLVDVSVLVQDAQTREPLPQAQVMIRLTRPGQPIQESPATQEAATNKLLHAALFQLPAPGSWKTEVEVEGPHGKASIACELEAGEPLPAWRELWPWIGWPGLVTLFFATHQVLRRRQAGRFGNLRPGE